MGISIPTLSVMDNSLSVCFLDVNPLGDGSGERSAACFGDGCSSVPLGNGIGDISSFVLALLELSCFSSIPVLVTTLLLSSGEKKVSAEPDMMVWLGMH